MQKAVSERKGQFNELHVCSYSQQIRNKTLWGEQRHKGGGNHSRSVYFINLLAGPVISVLVGRSSLARPCKTGREIYKARGENEGNKMKRRFKYRYIVKEELL